MGCSLEQRLRKSPKELGSRSLSDVFCEPNFAYLFIQSLILSSPLVSL